MAQYQPPNPPPNLYIRHDAQINVFSAIGACVAVTFLLGLIIGFVISVVSGPLPLGDDRMQRELARFSIGFYISAPIGLLVAAAEVVPALHVREQLRAEFYARHRAEWEVEQQRNRARQAYGEAYAVYLPKWQAWREAMRTYEAQLAAYQAWRAKFVAAWEAYHERGKEAAKLFERLHTNVQMRGRVELELSEPEHLQSLFREAISEVSKTNPDLGILRLITPFVSSEPPPAKEWNYNPRPDESLKEKYNWQQMWSATGEPVNHRQVHPVISHNLPELAYLFDDARLEAVVDLLPQVPGMAVEGTENRKEPERPAFPKAPANIIFSQQDANGYSAPVPPERVTWS